MKLVNEITAKIVKNARDGETIRSLAKRVGFAYSAVYKWVNILKGYGVIHLIEKGNKNIIKINKKNMIYKKFVELDKAISVFEKDKIFWDIVKRTKLKIRFVQNTAVVIWTQGSYITGDFMDRVYFVEVYGKDLVSFKKILKKYEIACSEGNITEKRPFVYVIPNKKKFVVERKKGLPVVPLRVLIKWCKKLYLENVLEQLSSMYDLKLRERYAEIKTNI